MQSVECGTRSTMPPVAEPRMAAQTVQPFRGAARRQLLSPSVSFVIPRVQDHPKRRLDEQRAIHAEIDAVLTGARVALTATSVMPLRYSSNSPRAAMHW
jgi:hypothetical protein